MIVIRDANIKGGVTLDKLTPLFEGMYNERQAASNAIVRLNEKLAEYELQIVPLQQYHIISLKEET